MLHSTNVINHGCSHVVYSSYHIKSLFVWMRWDCWTWTSGLGVKVISHSFWRSFGVANILFMVILFCQLLISNVFVDKAASWCTLDSWRPELESLKVSFVNIELSKQMSVNGQLWLLTYRGFISESIISLAKPQGNVTVIHLLEAETLSSDNNWVHFNGKYWMAKVSS